MADSFLTIKSISPGKWVASSIPQNIVFESKAISSDGGMGTASINAVGIWIEFPLRSSDADIPI